MCHRRWTSIGSIAALWMVLASSAPSIPAADDTWAEDGRNEIAFSVSASRNEDETGLGLGLDYERRLSHLFGVGGVIEYTSGDFREGIAVVSFDWHPWNELKVIAAPGVQVGRDDLSHDPVIRIGAEYGVEIGRGFAVAPSVSIDFTEDTHTVNLGVGFSKKF